MSYWTDVDPPMSFIPEKWTYDQKREFRYQVIPYLTAAAGFDKFARKRVLCVGDGSGIDAVEFARHGANVFVLDMSEKAMRLTRQHAREASVDARLVTFVEDACKMPFEPDVFDAVYSFGVYHHIPAVELALAETARVLRPGGQFFGMVYHKDSLLYAYSILRRAEREGITAERAMQLYSERNPGCPHSVAYTRRGWAALLAPLFSSVTSEVYYDVVDLENKRKVPLEVETAGANLGWHLFFRARKG